MATYTNQLMVYVNGRRQKIEATDNIEVGGQFTATTFNGSGSGLTSLPAGELTGALPALDGSLLTSLDADNISSGELNDARLSSNVPLLNAAANEFTGTLSALTLSGNGVTITAIAAGNITTGTLSDDRLSANVAKYADPAPHFTGVGAVQSDAGFSGPGGSLTGLSVTAIEAASPGDYLADGLLAPNILRTDAVSNTLTGNLTINGDLTVGGDVISGGSVNVVLSDQFLDLNGNNLLGSAQPGGIAVNVLSTGAPFDVKSFTASGAGTDPSCVVDGDATALTAGALVQISQSASANDGQYLVYSTSYNAGANETTVYMRGNATSAHPASDFPQLPFVHNQFTPATETAKLTAITVGVMAVSGGALFGPGHAVISPGTWCYAYGATAAQFTDGWISLAPAATPSLQDAYNASVNPASIEMTAAKSGFTLKPATGETAAFSFQANAASEIDVTAYPLDIKADRLTLLANEVVITGMGSTTVASLGSTALGDVCYIDAAGTLQLSDGEAVSLAAREVDGVSSGTGTVMASIFGTRVRVNYVGSAPAVGDLVYLGGNGNAGKCQVAVPTVGRVTSLGKCVVAGSGGECTIVWKPDYIIDL